MGTITRSCPDGPAQHGRTLSLTASISAFVSGGPFPGIGASGNLVDAGGDEDFDGEVRFLRMSSRSWSALSFGGDVWPITGAERITHTTATMGATIDRRI
jgi:hypothetical protein